MDLQPGEQPDPEEMEIIDQHRKSILQMQQHKQMASEARSKLLAFRQNKKAKIMEQTKTNLEQQLEGLLPGAQHSEASFTGFPGAADDLAAKQWMHTT